MILFFPSFYLQKEGVDVRQRYFTILLNCLVSFIFGIEHFLLKHSLCL